MEKKRSKNTRNRGSAGNRSFIIERMNEHSIRGTISMMVFRDGIYFGRVELKLCMVNKNVECLYWFYEIVQCMKKNQHQS